jgi:hypothetical protein
MKNFNDYCKFLFPDAPVYPDGVDCSYGELKSRTEFLLSRLLHKKTYVYFEDSALLYDEKPIIGGMSKNFIDYNQLISVLELWLAESNKLKNK